MKNTKKFDSKVVSALITKIEAELKKTKKDRDDVSLSIKEANILKSIDRVSLDKDWVYNPQGSWNGYGYGYERLSQHLHRDFLLVAKNALKKLTVEVKSERKILTEGEKIEKWAKRLSNLAEISIDEAKNIADEKLEYHQDRIEELESRGYSRQRMKIVAKLERENPLRRIVDIDHAQAILRASDRHNNTDYECQLEEAKEQAMMGNINRSEVKEYARTNMS